MSQRKITAAGTRHQAMRLTSPRRSAAEPKAVITTALSVYIRRGRLPEPSEILFCTIHSTAEEIELHLRRWIVAADTGAGGAMQLPANININQNTGDLGEKGDQIVDDIKTLSGGEGLEFVTKIAAIARDDDRAKESLQKALAHASITAPAQAAALD